MVKGITVNKHTLAVDLIEKVGPGGNYITEEHTYENFKIDWWFPTIFNRRRYDFWIADGQPDLADLAREKLADILENHKPERLNRKVIDSIQKIVASA
jgi:trimethylamine---corrinoid protein Co-methyltransferase